jgi:hypothetical protein
MQASGQQEVPADLHSEDTPVRTGQENEWDPELHGRFGEEQIPCPYWKSNPRTSSP